MLSAFVLIKLKIKQSLALSRRYNSPFFHLQPCWVSLTHTPIMKASRHPRGSLVSRSCHWVYHTPNREYPPPSPSSSCFLGTTKPALSSSLKIRGQWNAASVFARLRFTCSLQSARCSGVWTAPAEILAGHPQSPAPQQWQGSNLSLLMGYFRAVTVGPESQSAAWLHSTIATWSARKS